MHPDLVFKGLEDTVSRKAEGDFKAFILTNPVTKWTIVSDYVIADAGRFNDVFVYMVIPYDAYLDQVQDEIRKVSPSDIKRIKSVNQDMLSYLQSRRRFTFCFVPNRDRKWLRNGVTARQSISESIKTMEAWNDAAQQQDVIRRFKALYKRAEAKNFNVRLLGDITLATTFSAFVAYLLAKNSRPEVIGWLPDRDRMTAAYDAIAHWMFTINFSACCRNNNVDDRLIKLAIGLPRPPAGETKGNWYDELVRLPDHIAGTIAAWDIQNSQVIGDNPKFQQVLEHVLADNSNLVVLLVQLANGPVAVSRVEISRKAPNAPAPS